MGVIKTYKELSKSGIVALVLISVFGGYLAGHPLELNLSVSRLALTLLGIMLLGAGSSALNQVQERGVDAQMPRTRNRPIPSGRISTLHATLFSFVSMGAGAIILWNIDRVAAWMGIAAFVLYNGLYTLWWKKKWAFAAVPGAIPGALPIWMGYEAAADRQFAPGGIFLFLLLFFWQMPHFWALAIRFREDYAKGGIPTLPVAKGTDLTKDHIKLWCLGYVALAQSAPLFMPVGKTYLVIATLMSGKVLWDVFQFTKEQSNEGSPTSGDLAQIGWLPFFLSVNFSLIIYIAAAVIDLWLPWANQFWV